MTIEEDRRLLSTSGWKATPRDYSSLRTIWLPEDGSGRLTYGYGQTIYAKIECRWEIPEPGCLRLTYRESAPYQYLPGYTPPEGRAVRDLAYALSRSPVSGVQNILGRPYAFDYVLELSEAPWPAELDLPHDPPRVFHGHIPGHVAVQTAPAD